MNVVLQVVPKPHADLATVPLAIQFAKTDEGRQLIKAGIQDPAAVSIIYTAPPATPREPVETLRKAFDTTMKDPEFLADAQKGRLDIDPLDAHQAAAIIAGFAKLPPALVAKLKEVMVPKN
jgi:hypothetical protein